MKLALDTSQTSGSIALADADKLLYSAYFDLRITHSETLMPAIDAAIKTCGASPKEISELYVCLGPGSFTGLRIGLATAKGMAYGLDLPVYGFDALQLTAFPCILSNKKILAVIDARMKQVYAALYNPDLSVLQAPRVLDPQELLDWDLSGTVVTGSAVALVRPLLEKANLASSYAPKYFRIPKADVLFALPALLPPQVYRGEKLFDLEPLYLRESTAQIKHQQKKV